MLIRRLLFIVGVVLVLAGCTSDKVQDLLLKMQEEAEQGMMHGIELPIGSTFEQVGAKYGEPQEISNDECWTYSRGHAETDAFFFYAHDSCTRAEEINAVKPDSILNKISVSPEHFNIELTEQEVRDVLGNPDMEYWRDSYGGYLLFYKFDDFQLRFVANEYSSTRDIYEITVMENF